ncbi:MAG TPA: hypothetical protein VJT69_19095 [Pyrinomonadaceae bacterium]|nr:hypothetical protein [Pyrinomonadaceae bacterium]
MIRRLISVSLLVAVLLSLTPVGPTTSGSSRRASENVDQRTWLVGLQSYAALGNWLLGKLTRPAKRERQMTAAPPVTAFLNPAPFFIDAPTNLTVTSAADGQITLSWTAPPGSVTNYQVERAAVVGSFGLLNTASGTTFADQSASVDHAYLYRVRAVAPGGAVSPPSNMAFGTATSFEFNDLLGKDIKAQHFYDVRTAINAVRALANVPLATWTPRQSLAGLSIEANDVQEMRNKLQDALDVLNISWPPYADPVLSTGNNGTPIRAIHLEQLQARSTRGSSGSSVPPSSDLSTTRLDPMNQTGGGGENPLSRNFNWNTPLLKLSGRAGLDLELTLSYNSLVWTKAGNTITFDLDKGFPGPGFRLGFPTIQPLYYNYDVNKYAYMLIKPDGGRVELRQVGTTALYEAADSSHLLFDSNSLILRTTDGTQLKYEFKGNEFQCTEVKDRNGNFITINYTSFGRISNIVDTLGRTITFEYNTDNNLTFIKQAWTGQQDPHVWASFSYISQTITTKFPQSLTKIAPAEVKALRTVTLNDGSRFEFDYSSWGQILKINNKAADNHLLNYRSYNLPADATNEYPDCPRFTERRDWAENWNRSNSTTGLSGLPSGAEGEVLTATWAIPASGSWTMPDDTQQSGMIAQVTLADGTYVKPYFAGEAGGTTGWQRSLPSLVETYGRSKPADPITKQKSVATKWTQDDTGVSYLLNPRVEETNVYDYLPSGQILNRARTRLTYQSVDLGNGASCHLPNEFYEYQSNATTVLRRTHTDYNTNSAYISRRILGLISGSSLYETNPTTNVETLVAKTGFDYDEALSIQGNDAPVQHESTYDSNFLIGRGNQSTVKRYDVGDLTQVTTSKTKFNTAGAPVVLIDAMTHQQTISYADSYSDGNDDRNTLAYPTSVTNADTFTSTAKYNFNFGAVTRTQTPTPAGQTAGTIRNFTHDDKARLLKMAIEFGENADYAHMRFEYPNSQNRIDTYVTVQQSSSEAHSFKMFDGHGRVFAAAVDHPGSTNGFSAQLFLFDKLGQIIKSSNPTETDLSGIPVQWRALGDDQSTGWLYSQQTYDWKGRPLVTTNPDLTTEEASYSGCGCAGSDATTLTDAGTIDAGTAKLRQMKIYRDVLGRTVKTEVLNWQNGTAYSTVVNVYNARDQVTKVKEYAGAEGTGTPLETALTYDGFGRLKTKRLPQYDPNVTTTYDYNADDTVQKVTDPRGATATMSYNNRRLVTEILYGVPSGSNIPVTPTVSFGYDAAGNRTSMSDGMGTVSYQYNQLSRLTSESRTFNDPANTAINGVVRTISYDYNPAGQISSITNPFGAVINYGFDATGRMNSISGTGYPVSQFVTGMTYRAWNTLKSQTNGNGFTESATYNSRLQMTGFEVRKSTNEIVMSTSNQYYNDGQLKFSDALDERFDRAFSYDHAGRIKETYTGSEARDFNNNTSGSTPTGPYRQSFQYNAFNQLTQQTDRLWSVSDTTTTSYANNRRVGWTYDAAGRLLVEDSVSYTIDAAGRITHTESPGFSNSVDFDGNGQVIKETKVRPPVLGHTITIKTYSLSATPLGNAVVVELNPSGGMNKEFVHAGARTIAETFSTTVEWKHQDPVTGSTGESTSSAAYTALGEPNALGVNVGLTEPPQQAPGTFDIPEPMLSGANLFSASSCSGTNCTTCYLNGIEHDCGNVYQLGQAGALKIRVDNAVGESKYVDAEGYLGGLYTVGRYYNTVVELADRIIFNINLYQGSFIPLPAGPAVQQNPKNPLNPKQQERMKQIRGNFQIPLNYFNILEDTKERVRKRLQNPNCRALLGNADVDDILENKTTISPFDQEGVVSNKEGVAAETMLRDDQGNRTLNGSINFTPLNSSPFFFSGLTASGYGLSGRSLSQNDLRDLTLIHELVHTGDITGKYDDVVGKINSRLNRLILKNCF